MCNAAPLFAMGLGFFVCYFARKADDEIKSLGRVVGLLILGLSTLFVFLNLIGLGQMGQCAKSMKCMPHYGTMR